MTTGDQSDAGSQAQAHIVLIGTEAATEKIPLVLIQREGFTPGLTETFSVEAADVGDVKKVELSNNSYGADSGWFVKEVEVDVPTSGKKYFFPCNRWLAQNKEDGKVVRVLSASDDQLVTYKPREFFDRERNWKVLIILSCICLKLEALEPKNHVSSLTVDAIRKFLQY